MEFQSLDLTGIAFCVNSDHGAICLLGHASVPTTERHMGCKQNLEEPVNDRFGCLFASRIVYSPLGPWGTQTTIEQRGSSGPMMMVQRITPQDLRYALIPIRQPPRALDSS